MADKLLRCAVYTRKSTEDGLEQEFNSLDAQYDACSSYALSQKHEGWSLVETRYDDGGFSGGNMQRPGLTRLLADVAAGRVDIILIYKIDRLTRSLADFAKIVDVLDAAGASFVSITQSFNTTTSMGRLTLNMLLSFAQFEREITGERIRDKIAASKRKGLWMGGPVPLGYDVVDRKLVVNATEAGLVRHAMQRYLALPSVRALADELNADGHRTKIQVRSSGPHRGGCPFSRGTLYHLLANRTYLGELVHKGDAFPGEHDAIVSRTLWDAVQIKLAAGVADTTARVAARHVSLLTSRLFDGEGRAMTPSHAMNHGKRYRYYVTRPNLVTNMPAWRVLAPDIEGKVCQRLAELFSNQPALCDLAGSTAAATIQQMLSIADAAAATLRSGTPHAKLHVIGQLVERIVLGSSQICVVVDRAALAAELGLDRTGKDPQPLTLTMPFVRERPSRGLRLVLPAPATDLPAPAIRDERLVRLIAEARAVQRLVLADPQKPLAEIAAAKGKCRKRMSKLLTLSCLAPDVVEAILDGHRAANLTAATLLGAELPLAWEEQAAVLKIAGLRLRQINPIHVWTAPRDQG